MVKTPKLSFKSLPLDMIILLLLMNLLHGVTGSEYSVKIQERIKCPLRCKCDRNPDNSTKWEVQCDAHTTWTKIPMLPDNTIYLSINKSSIPILQNGVVHNVGGKTLITLILREDKMSTIDVNYFKGMDQLKNLTLSVNNLKNLSNGTFAGIPNLLQLSLGSNKFETIPSQNICLLKKLQILDISLNNVKSAKFDSCFSDLEHLYIIDISSNPIGKIQSDDLYALRKSQVSAFYLKAIGLTALQGRIFKWLPNLKVLNLQENKLWHLKSDSFQYIKGLTSLTLRGNNLNEIPSDAIATLSNLQILDMGKTSIRNSTLDSEFKHLRHLTQLQLSNNPLFRLTNNSFLSLNSSTDLTELDLRSCKLEVIEADAFLPLRFLVVLRMDTNSKNVNTSMFEQAFYGLRFARNLTEIYMDSTNLADLNNMTFQYLVNTSVKSFRARGSKIKIIPSGSFKHLPSLQHLDLEGNWIQEIEPNAFNSVNQIATFDIMKNNLALVPNANSLYLRNLKCFVLARNAILSLRSFFLKGYGTLEEFSLHNNRLTVLTSYVFIYVPNLKILDLSKNQIYGIANDAFVGLAKLERLVLDQNNIANIGLNAFSHTPNLLDLELSENNRFTSIIKYGVVELFEPLTKLTTLQLISTGLDILPNNVFHNLTQLSTLSLSKNLLPKLDPSIFRYQTKLKILTLRSNKLTFLNSTVLDHLTSLEELDLSKNMFRCECDLMWMTNWIRSGLVYMMHLGSTTCKSPAQKRGVLLQNLYMERECMNYSFYYICWFLLLCYALIVILACVTYRLRWYLKYWLHLVRARKAMEREMGEERYVFDAFVSYAHQDMKWVVRELLPKLEYEAKIRLCLHQRNWLAGRAIARNIIDSIEKSRKTVLVLSNSFARSKWGELEMSLAQHKLLTTRRDIVVPILLEEVDKKYVTEQMVCLFATQTYVRWPRRNEKEQRKFWATLIKTLRPPKATAVYDEDNRDFLTSLNAIRPAL